MLKRIVIILVMCLATVGLVTGTLAQQARPAAVQGKVPKDPGKQTSLGKYVTALEAYLMYRANPEKIVLLDVRTPEEYSFLGHAPAAVNIPSKLWTGKFNAEAKEYALADNPDFETAVKARFKPEDTLLVMCRSGGRSAAAVELLAKAGFRNAYNVTDGFEGDKVTEEDSYIKGKRLKNGWRNSGVPWTTDLDPKLVYVFPAKSNLAAMDK